MTLSQWTTTLAAAQPDEPLNFWMPPNAATQAANVDGLFNFILWICVIAFIGITFTTVYFVVKYRRRGKDDRTSAVEGSPKLEIAWSIIPAIFMIVIFLWGFRDWMDLNVPPANAKVVRVTAQKWSWSFDYPKDGCAGLGTMTVPVNMPIKLTMSSRDVLHSFYIPAFRVKRDVLPNRYSVIWFEATKIGTYDIYCTEYCGTQHSRMLSKVKVVSAANYRTWVEEGCGMGNLPPKELGEMVFSSRGCTACHSKTGDRRGLPGPPLGGKYGTMEKTVQGTFKVDDNYIRESLMEPNAKVVVGFPPVMPTFRGQLTDKQINGLIDYIKSLKK